jgi:acetyl-CoA carboxylase carboxyltransferase component
MLNTIVPEDPSQSYSMKNAIHAIMDQGSFLEIQAGYAPNAIVAWHAWLTTGGVVSQEPAMMAGVMDINSADKISRLCVCVMLSTSRS